MRLHSTKFWLLVCLVPWHIMISAIDSEQLKNKNFFIKKNIKNIIEESTPILDPDFIKSEKPKSDRVLDDTSNVFVDFPLDFLVKSIPVLENDMLLEHCYKSFIKIGTNNILYPLFKILYVNDTNKLTTYWLYLSLDFLNNSFAKKIFSNCKNSLFINAESFILGKFLIKLKLANKNKNLTPSNNLVKTINFIDVFNLNITLEDKVLDNFNSSFDYQLGYLNKTFFENLFFFTNRFRSFFLEKNHFLLNTNAIVSSIENGIKSSPKLAFILQAGTDYLPFISNQNLISKYGVNVSYTTNMTSSLYNYICPFLKIEYNLKKEYKIYLYCLDKRIDYQPINKIYKRTNIINTAVSMPFENIIELANVGFIFDYSFYSVIFGGKYVYVNNSFHYIATHLKEEDSSPNSVEIVLANKNYSQLYLNCEYWNFDKDLCIRVDFAGNIHGLLNKNYIEYFGNFRTRYKYKKFILHAKLSTQINSLYQMRISNKKQAVKFCTDRLLVKTKIGLDYLIRDNFCVFFSYELQLNPSNLKLNIDPDKFGRFSIGLNYFL